MQMLSTLLGYAGGAPLPEEDAGPARRMQLGLASFLLAIAFAAVFGAAAGSSAWTLALANVLKVPVVVLLSAVCALPAGFLAWKLSGARIAGGDLLLTFGASVFVGTLVLAAAAPLVALYYHSSAWAGPALGVGSVFLALFVGALFFVKGATARVDGKRRSVLVPVGVMLFMQLATLVQFVALASPIFPEVTVFDGGIDRILR